MDAKTALITGITGQDGSLLAKHLIKKGYQIIAATRKTPNLNNLAHLDLLDNYNIKFIEYSQWLDFDNIIKTYKPSEIYHLAAISHVGQSHSQPDMVFDVNINWTVKLLNFVLHNFRQSKFFFASSCEIFKNDLTSPVNATDEKQPTNPYGISKLAAHQMVQYYRNVHGLFACNGILFNHESELRGDNFVSKKIAREVARIVKYGGKPLMLGNVDARKDWGYAPDYVQAFHAMLQRDKADDVIIASGKLHSVKDMVEAAFAAFDCTIAWQGIGAETTAIDNKGNIVVAINAKYYRPLDNRFICGNTHKARHYLQFNNLTPFDQWVKSMTASEYEKL
ncbi:MAG: GDP-mannose 4,6-dehydratase [Proteobacteria bacterium]|nr:GDP-mannose 4,6-dehydratase [Pseudomonadota bacterium]